MIQDNDWYHASSPFFVYDYDKHGTRDVKTKFFSQSVTVLSKPFLTDYRG